MNLIRTPFRLGRKEVYLPDFRLTLLRTPNLPPRFAAFIVPLNLNKLDMRDYLYHAYNIRVSAIRSSINAPTIRQGHPMGIKPQPKRWYRLRAQKKMTVEMDKPFFWPKEMDQEELDENFNKGTFDEAERAGRIEKKKGGSQGDTVENKADARSMREQARRLLSGRERWAPAGEARNIGMAKGPLKF